MNVLIDGEIVLYGTVGDDWWGDGFTARDVADALAVVGRNAPLTVRINSPGGYTSDGGAIHAMLANRPGETTVIIEGQALSAASVIAMAGDKVVMRKGAVMMIHDPAGITWGTASDHAKTIESLEAIAATMADIYAEKTGRPVEDIRAEMREEIWLTPAQALEKGYVDLVDESAAPLAPTAFDYRMFKHAPAHLMARADVRPPKRDRQPTAASPAATPRQQETIMANEEAGKKPADEKKVVSLDEARTMAAAAATEAVAAARAQDKEVRELCALAGKPDRATAFIDAGVKPDEVRAALLTEKASAKGDDQNIDTKQPAPTPTASAGGLLAAAKARYGAKE